MPVLGRTASVRSSPAGCGGQRGHPYTPLPRFDWVVRHRDEGESAADVTTDPRQRAQINEAAKAAHLTPEQTRSFVHTAITLSNESMDLTAAELSAGAELAAGRIDFAEYRRLCRTSTTADNSTAHAAGSLVLPTYAASMVRGTSVTDLRTRRSGL